MNDILININEKKERYKLVLFIQYVLQNNINYENKNKLVVYYEGNC